MFVPSYLSVSRHGVFYFRWPMPPAIRSRRHPTTIKVSLRTRDPKEALRCSRTLSYLGQTLMSLGIAAGMNFDEIRRLLRGHFIDLLEQKRAQIAKDGRLRPLDVSALQNGSAFAREALQSGSTLYPGEDDGALLGRFITKYGLSIQPNTAAHENLRTELQRAYRDYCSTVLEYDRSLETYELGTDTAGPAITAAPVTRLPYVTLTQFADRYAKEGNLGSQWVSKTELEKLDHINLLTENTGPRRRCRIDLFG